MIKQLIYLVLLVFVVSCAHKAEKADLIVHNAKIYALDEKQNVYEAMAVKDGKIIELGAERSILNKYHSDIYYDAKTRPVYPGFIDAHGHILNYGLSLIYVDLVGTKSWEEVIERLEKYRTAHPEMKVIRGRGWDQNDWVEQQFPVNDKLNELFPDIPVFLERIDGHAAIANFKALDLAGVNENSRVEGGAFISENGKLTGVMIDNAMEKVRSVLPQPDEKLYEEALLSADKKLVSYGLTTVDDAGVSRYVVQMMKRLMKEKKFRLRVYAMIMASREDINYYSVEGPYKDEQLHICSFKFLADGALGSRGACLKKPYSDVDEKHYGTILYDYGFLKRSALILYESGFQMNTHAIGDSANKAMLDIYAEVLKDMNDKRWRIEHAQVIDPSDFSYFNKYSVIPSVQPTHATSDMPWAEKRLGHDRMKGAYAYKTLLQANGWLPLGTDFPVESPDPLKTFYAAVFRKNNEGLPADGFQIQEALSRIEALKGMTIWAAMANFEEQEKGTLETGKLADFVVLSNDILTISEAEILRAHVITTWINGEQVYSYE